MQNKDYFKIKNRCILISSAIAFSMVFAVGCSGDNKSNYQLAVDALNNQNYSEALTLFEAAQNEDTNKQLVYRGLGMANLGLAQYDQSIECFDNALHQSNGLIKSIDYDINFYLAAAQYKKGDYQSAYNTYEAICTLDKSNSDARYLMGKTSLDMGDIEKAKENFEEAIRLKPSDPYLYINIYKELVNYGYENEAKSYINLALKNVSKPSSYELGIFNYYLGDYTQARNYFEESKDVKKNADSLIYLGKTYEALGDTGYAASLYEAYLTNDPSSSEMYNELGNLKFAEKDYEGALATYEAGLKSSDKTYMQSLMFNRIVAYEYLGDYKTAATLMKEYLSTYPNDEQAKREDVFLRTR